MQSRITQGWQDTARHHTAHIASNALDCWNPEQLWQEEKCISCWQGDTCSISECSLQQKFCAVLLSVLPSRLSPGLAAHLCIMHTTVLPSYSPSRQNDTEKLVSWQRGGRFPFLTQICRV